MTNSDPKWLYRKGDTAQGVWETVIDDTVDGWTYTGLRVAELAGERADLPAGNIERIVVPLRGSFEVAYEAENGDAGVQQLSGRESVFAAPTDVIFLGAGTAASLTGTGRVAVAEAPTAERRGVRYVGVDEVAVELRGAGRSSRQVNDFGLTGVLPEAARLLVCEVITPAGNSSSYPPHKHDEEIPGQETELEEIYYFEAAPTTGDGGADAAFGVFHTYGSAEIDALVRSGDVALVPRGYHGPAVAMPGYDLYYLNVMAGPAPERVWRASDDPDHAWVRKTWETEAVDDRLPFGAPTGD